MGMKRAFFRHGIGLGVVIAALATAAYADILEQTDGFLGRPSFQDAFRDGDAARFEQRDCVGVSSAGPCDTMRGAVKVEVDAANRVARFLYLNPQGGVVRQESLSERDWSAALGNRLRMEIAVLQSYAFEVKLERLEQAQAEVEINGRLERIPSLRIALTARNPAGFTVTETLELARDLPGMAQLARKWKRTTGGLVPGTQVYELKSWSRR